MIVRWNLRALAFAGLMAFATAVAVADSLEARLVAADDDGAAVTDQVKKGQSAGGCCQSKAGDVGKGGGGCCESGGGCGGCAGGDDPGGKVDFATDREVFQFLLANHDQIQRLVIPRPDGVETVTESGDRKIADKIREHVGAMAHRVEVGSGIHLRDPLFAALFRHADEIRMTMEPTENGIRVIEVSDDPYVARLIRAHSRVLTRFVTNGHAEVQKNHVVPAPDPVLDRLSAHRAAVAWTAELARTRSEGEPADAERQALAKRLAVAREQWQRIEAMKLTACDADDAQASARLAAAVQREGVALHHFANVLPCGTREEIASAADALEPPVQDLFLAMGYAADEP